MTLTPEDLRELLIQLQTASPDIVLVGGQAVNLWATHYADATERWQSLRPYASRDIDFFGSRLEVLNCASQLGGEARVNRDFDSSPNTGIVTVLHRGQRLQIDFLATVFGLSDDDIVSTAVDFKGKGELAGVELKVLNPVLCLEGKIKSLQNLPQAGRQDAKHSLLSVLSSREYLSELCQDMEPRVGLKAVERILRLGGTESSLNAWYKIGLRAELALPVEQLRSYQDPIWQKFIQIRLPQAMEALQTRRERYRQISERIEQRNQSPRNQDPSQER